MKKKDWFTWRRQVTSCHECKPLTKVWLFALATFSDEFGFCHPNQDQIAERMGRKSKKNLERCVKQASECGHIVVGYKITNSGKSNNYTLRLLTLVEGVTPSNEDESNPLNEVPKPHSEVTNPHDEVTNPHSGDCNSSNNTSTNSFIKENSNQEKPGESDLDNPWTNTPDEDRSGTDHIDIGTAKKILASSKASKEETELAWAALSGKLV